MTDSVYTQLLDTYRRRAASFQAEAEAGHARYNRLSVVRLVVFLAAILVAIYCWSIHWLAFAGFLLLFIAGFYRFMRWHLAIQREAEHRERLARINTWEGDAVAQLFPPESLWSDGAVFADTDHPYTLDLDVFGRFSFFHYANRAGTWLGRQRLAAWLRKPSPVDEIRDRQAAVAELAEALDWRQHLQAHGLEANDEQRHSELLGKWLHDEPFVRTNRWWQLARIIVPLWMTAGLVLGVLFLSWKIVLGFLILPAWILHRTRKQVDAAHQRTGHAEAVLQHYARLIRHLESADWQSAPLQRLRTGFHSDRQPASAHVQQLSYLISQLNVRYNVFAIFLNLFALWDLHWVARLERWREQHREALPGWFDALAEFEALSSLATARFNNPDWAFPTLSDRPVLEAEALGHPLIHFQRRVSNDLHMPIRGHIKLITGSNMAGKSTFLRTAGLNIVLAMAGAPVCARRLTLPPIDVFTSMRTQDALHESTSSFYAELKRLKFIIEAVEDPNRQRPVFFLLDEILKGTNSRDRHTGSRALIRQLIHSGGAGLIATHDLELGDLEARYGGAIENLCMEVQIKDSELYFDYTLKPGVSQSFNATLLMKKMGIKVKEE